MKKQLALLAALLICVSAFAACKKFTPELIATETTEVPESVSVFGPETSSGGAESAAPQNTSEEQPTEAPSQTEPAGTTSAPEETEEYISAAGPTEPAPTIAPAPLNGTTAKGYEIRTVNGVTYVAGLLIANKSYSLPEDYVPADGDLTADTYAAYDKMKSAAAEDGIELFIISGYRSYETQNNLYNRYCAQDGKAAADRYSARPGHSEHQSGYAMDLNSLSQSFADTAEGRWIAGHCWEYGFILRYPKEKEAQTGYMYEPWHLRYVGVEKALDIRDSGLCLEEYLGISSVYAD